MITLYLIVLLIQLIFFKRQSGVLACGLIGYCGSKPADPWKLKLLFLYNLKRGEHATGISIDKVIHKQTVPANKFLADHHDLFESISEAKDFTIIGHDRQASVGSKDKLELAHPHYAEGKTKIILAHNGTLQNVQAIAKKYNIEHTYYEQSDSQTLTNVLASLPEEEFLEVLQGYTGTASLLFQLPKYKNTLFVHRDPERDLFCLREEGGIYISSIAESLHAIGGTKETVEEFVGHTLYRIQKGVITKEWKTNIRKPIELPQERRINTVKTPSFQGAYSFYQEDDLSTKTVVVKNGLTVIDGVYYLNGHLYTGVLYFNILTCEYSNEKVDGMCDYWFINGIMMRDEMSYKALFDIVAENNIVTSSQVNKKLYCSDISEYSMFPVKSPLDIIQGSLFFPVAFHQTKYGIDNRIVFSPYLSDKVYTINANGVLISTEIIPNIQPKKINKLKDKSLLEQIKDCCSNNTFNDVGSLYATVRIAMNIAETEETYYDFADAFIKMCYEDNIVTNEYTDNITDSLNKGNTNLAWDSLNTLLGLYNEYKKLDDNLSLESEIENLRKDNKWINNEGFLRDVDNCNYTELDDMVVDYCVTDEDVHTVPFIQAVALELRRLGILTDTETVKIYKMKPATAFKELKRKWAIYTTLKGSSECNTCDVKTPTDILAEKFMEAERLNSLKTSVITSDQLATLEKLRGEIKDMLVEKNNINIEILKNKYGIFLHTIQEAYA